MSAKRKVAAHTWSLSATTKLKRRRIAGMAYKSTILNKPKQKVHIVWSNTTSYHNENVQLYAQISMLLRELRCAETIIAVKN